MRISYIKMKDFVKMLFALLTGVSKQLLNDVYGIQFCFILENINKILK